MTADPFVKGRLSAAVDVEPIDLETHLRTVIEGRDAPARLPRSWRWPVAAGALAAAVAAVALAVWAFSSYRAPPPAHRPTPTPRTASPHVGRLVFVAAVPRGDGLGPDSIYLLKPGARRATRLYGPLTIAGVAGSPDGRYVAFSRGLGEGEGEILISSVMGGLLEHVTRLGVPQQPAWSPEGSEIAFTTGKSIHVIQTDGGGLRPVTHPGRTCDDLWPAWSPNALRIAFVRECVTRSGTPGLYVVAANGTGARVVVATGHVDGISWSPDGQTIAFASGAGAGRADDIRFLDPSTGRVRDLTPDPATETRPAWSPDGEWIGFIRNGRVFAMHPDGSDSQVITGTIGLVATYLAWMPAPEETPIRPSPKPTPTEEPAGSFSPPLAAVAFVDAGHGWIAGTGVILGTSDGGRTWTRQYGGPADITQLEFVDSRHGWAVGRRELLVTRDGGQTWTRAGEPSSPVSQVHFLDDRRGWGIVGNAGDVPRPVGRIVATSDGGATWNPLPGAPQASALCFVSSSIAYAASGKEVFASADGGGTWTTTFDAPMLGRGWTDMLSCSPDGEVWLLVVGGAASCQEAYVAFHSADGRNWTPIAEEGYFGVEYPKVSTTNILGGYTGPVAAIAPGRAAYVGFGPCGDEASVSLTENGGRTFEGIKLPAITRVAGVSFADSQHGWIVGPDVGGHGVAYRTGDGGRTWTRVEIRI